MADDLIKIDGSLGEGGGQILRTSLSLSAITKKPFEIYNIRASRKTPGLSHQHLQAVNATALICNAEVAGNTLRSVTLKFYPDRIQHGTYTFNIGTAGSISLVLQTIFYPLSFTKSPSTLTIAGGTHVTHSPCTDYLERQWLFFLRKIGYDAEIKTIRAGFYPRGGGEVAMKINPSRAQQTIQIEERGRLLRIRGISMVSNLDINIAKRQQIQTLKLFSELKVPHEISLLEMPAIGKGTMLFLIGEFEHSQCCYFSLGEIGKRAETVAEEACNKLKTFLKTKGTFDEYLADQIIIPLALANKKTEFTTPIITQHLLTNIQIIKQFLPIDVKISESLNEEGTITIQPL
ncbi:MAG: RNA 3'-phosphate cyclase [Candidatus Kuenenia sp.]|nr:RNA 3'-phosphate cyclase [Candidatus Kuenenia hertensis]